MSDKYASTSSWKSFLKSIASFKGDISALTAPPFILSPQSLVEFSMYWAMHQHLYMAPNFIDETNFKDFHDKDSPSPDMARMLGVVEWFISCLRSQYFTRSQGSEKKPLNPFLGEVFVGKWENKDDPRFGETVLLSEQVSHHPPMTAFSVFNDKNDVKLQGYSRIKATFSKTLTLGVKQYGHTVLTYGKHKETYLVTVPPLHIEGILHASPFAELESKAYIQSSTGIFTVIEFSGRGYFSGKKNTMKAKVYLSTDDYKNKQEPLYTIQGQWSGVCTITKVRPNTEEQDVEKTPLFKDVIFFDTALDKIEPLVVKPIEKQHPLESRKAWFHVAEAIKSGDYEKIVETKTALEESQRALRKEEEEAGTKWQRRWFFDVDYDRDFTEPQAEEKGIFATPNDKFVVLSNMIGLSLKDVPSGTLVGDKEDKKEGVSSLHWRFDRQLWDEEKEVEL